MNVSTKNDQSLAQAWIILPMKRFWHKEMLDGLRNYLTAI